MPRLSVAAATPVSSSRHPPTHARLGFLPHAPASAPLLPAPRTPHRSLCPAAAPYTHLPRVCAAAKRSRAPPRTRVDNAPEAASSAAASAAKEAAAAAAATGSVRSDGLLRKRVLAESGNQHAPPQLPLPDTLATEIDRILAAHPHAAPAAAEKVSHLLESYPLPSHRDLRVCVLENGFSFVILPSASPAARFEAHLEVCAGSADEMDHQQGIAHLVEHIAYMGSRKRDLLLTGTGAQTNAYTDFHHTVFHASCPIVDSNDAGRNIVRLALDTLHEVLSSTKFEQTRLEKERAAVLSELRMVNTIEYRTEVQLISFLHPENRLPLRFPIGMEEQISKWDVKDASQFYLTHYRPDNAVLYLVGDFPDIDLVEAMVRQKFGPVKPRDLPLPLTPEPTLKDLQSKFFPPVVHKWASQGLTNGPVSPSLFRHDLLQGYSLHILAKYPIQPLRTLHDYKQSVIRSVIMMALQVRFNVQARSAGQNGSLFSFVETAFMNSSREGCAVVSLDMVADREQWDTATRSAIVELRRLAEHGLAPGEVDRFVSLVWANSEQLCAQAERTSNSQQVELLMEALASGDVYMSPEQYHQALGLVLSTLSMDDVNDVARQLTDHVDTLASSSTVAACVPTYGNFDISENDLRDTISRALEEEVVATEEVDVPSALMTADDVAALSATAPSSVNFLSDEGEHGRAVKLATLENGITVNLLESGSEADRMNLRITSSGGRAVESAYGSGSVAVGGRTMQEGGAIVPFSRQQVELFCVDNLIQVDIGASTEFLYIDMSFPTSKVEFVLQLIHRLVAGDFIWEQDAFFRAKQSFLQTQGEIERSLEDAAAEQVMRKLCGGDPRFLTISEEKMTSLTLDQTKAAIQEHLTTDSIELSLVGDIPHTALEPLLATYLGSIPATQRSEKMEAAVSARSVPLAFAEGSADDFVFELADTDHRAAAFVGGPCPGILGFRRDGSHIATPCEGSGQHLDMKSTQERRSHPAFAGAVSSLLQQVINRRLFTELREKERLTYDAKFSLAGYDRLWGGWFISEVTASPDKVERALEVMQGTLVSMKTRKSEITRDNLESARRTLLVRIQSDYEHNDYVIHLISGMQLSDVPLKRAGHLTEVIRVLRAITTDDLHSFLDEMALETSDSGRVVRCIARTKVDKVSASSDDGVTRGGFRSGTALGH